MHHFEYVDGLLQAEDLAVSDLAATVGTPFYCYSSATLSRHYQVFSDAFNGMDSIVCYSVKANSNIAVLRTLANLGSGADIVSVGELLRAQKAGIPAERIVFSGVGKTAAEMRVAIAAGVLQFNVESEPELNLLNEVACDMGVQAPVAGALKTSSACPGQRRARFIAARPACRASRSRALMCILAHS